MTTTGATICWGVVLTIGLSLPAIGRESSTTGRQGPTPAAQTPQAPAPAEPSTPASSQAAPAPPQAADAPQRSAPRFERAWIQSLPSGAPRSLTLTPSHVIVASADAPVEARATSDGALSWKTDVISLVIPAVVDDVVIGADRDAVNALDERTGQPRWSAPIAGVTSLSAGSASVVVSAPQGIRALRATDGTPLWSYGVAGDAAPVVTAGAAHVFVASGQHLAALDRLTGAVAWERVLDLAPLTLSVNPALVFFTTTEGYVCAFRVSDGGEEWCFPVRVRPIGAPLAHDDHLYVSFLDATVRVFDAHNGARRRTLTASSRPVEGPSVAGDLLAVPLVTSEFVVFDSRQDFTMTRVPGFDPAETPPTTQAAVVSPDGALLSMVMTSPARTSLVGLTRKN